MGNHYVIFGIPIPNQLNAEINRCSECKKRKVIDFIFREKTTPFCKSHHSVILAELPLFLRQRLPKYQFIGRVS